MTEHFIDRAMWLSGLTCATVVIPICYDRGSPIPPETVFDGILMGENVITASFTDLMREGGFFHIPFPVSGYGTLPSEQYKILLWRVERLSNVPEGWVWAQPPGFEWRDRDGHLHPRVVSTSCHSMARFDGLFDPWVWVLSIAPRR